MAWEVPQFSTGSGNQSQVVQQSFAGRPQGQQGAQQTRPVAASSVDANGNTVATNGQLPSTGNPMFRPGSVLGTFLPDAQKMGGTDWGAAIGRLMGLGG